MSTIKDYPEEYNGNSIAESRSFSKTLSNLELKVEAVEDLERFSRTIVSVLEDYRPIPKPDKQSPPTDLLDKEEVQDALSTTMVEHFDIALGRMERSIGEVLNYLERINRTIG